MAFTALLDELRGLGRDGEWSGTRDDGVAVLLTIAQGGQRISFELENGGWCLAWAPPGGEWRIEAHGFAFDQAGWFRTLVA